jgi:hypothetical protein
MEKYANFNIKPTILDDNGVFFIIIYFQGALIFHKTHIYCY